MKRARRTIPMQAGFTLVEVLVSLTILSMVLALLLTGMRMGGRSLQAVELHSAESEALFQSQHLLRDLLEQAQPYMEEDASGNKILLFSGDQRSLQFVAPATRNLGWAGLMYYRLDLVESASAPDALALHLSYRPTGVADAGQAEDVVIMQGSGTSRFSYYGRDASGRTGWHSQWRHPEALPEVISLAHGGEDPADLASLPPDLYAVMRTSWYVREN